MRTPDFWSANDRTARFVSAILAPVGWVYGASVAFKRDHAKSFHPRAKVLCVGNLTAGGSGKTPVAISLACMLLERGKRVCFLSRGYGGKLTGPVVVRPDAHTATEVGDEALLLAAVATTIVSADRRAGADLADAQGAEVIIMDDGHQNFGLKKSLSVVVIDAETGYGNRKCLPAGPLREPVAQGLARADAVILVGEGMPGLDGYDGVVLRAHVTPQADSLGQKRIAAFAGIGRPSKFFAMLERMGADLIFRRAFPDHHAYTRAEIAEMKAAAREAEAVLVTTEKDLVRLNREERDGIMAVRVKARFDSPAEVRRLLDGIVATST